jgi:hypothetical protein
MKKIILFLLISCQCILAQNQFEARVSKTTLGLNERLRVDFFMNFDGDNFKQPSFEGFRVLAGPSQQVSQSWINGRSTFEKMYSYYLVPNQKGVLTIAATTIEFDGTVYKSNPIKITVTNAIKQPEDPNNQPAVSADDNIYLVADISNANPYLNEPITVVYKLYFSYNVGISDWKEVNNPKYNNFWSQNIDIKQLKAEEGTFKGQKYRFVVLRKTVLYPQQSGKLEIEPLTLDINAQLPTNRRDVFGRVMVTEAVKTVSAGSRIINVKPLPEAGKPDDFTGAVGSFDFKVKPSKAELKNGESLDLIVSVSGQGNLKLFTLPKPVVPNALEMYDPVHDEKVTTPLNGMTGSIADKYTIVPQYKGLYTIDAMHFSYFDTKTKKYKTIASEPITINVLNGPTNESTTDDYANKNVIKTSEQFKFIKLKTSLQDSSNSYFMGSFRFYALLIFPFLLLPLIVFFVKKKHAFDSDIIGNKIRNNNRLAKKYLSEAKKQINNKELFYVALEKAMHNFLKAKLRIETADMSKENIKQLLTSRSVVEHDIQNFINLTENCELARFAPASQSVIEQDFEKALQIISDLEKQL